MKKRATKRRGSIEPVTRAMVETLEQRVLYDVTYVDFSGSGTVAEGQVVTYNISAGTDHDFIPGTIIHASVNIQQTGNDGSQTNTSYNVELQPDQPQNLYVFAHEEGSIVAEAECWDDPMYTYGFTSSEQAVYADPTTVTDAPLSPMNGMSSFFDYTDTSPGATAPRPVAEFFDANPDAQASDFSVQSIDWGDGTTPDQGGYVQKDVDGVGWDVMAYHYYGGPNPATSLDGDGAWYPQASVMDEGGAAVTTQGKAAVAATRWLNATYDPVTVPPAWPWQQQPLPQPNNDVLDFSTLPTVMGVRSITFYVAEYDGMTNVGPPHTLISANLVSIAQLPDSTASVTGWALTGKTPHMYFGSNTLRGYEFVQVTLTVKNVLSSTFLHLHVSDPFAFGDGAAGCDVRCNFGNPFATH